MCLRAKIDSRIYPVLPGYKFYYYRSNRTLVTPYRRTPVHLAPNTVVAAISPDTRLTSDDPRLPAYDGPWSWEYNHIERAVHGFLGFQETLRHALVGVYLDYALSHPTPILPPEALQEMAAQISVWRVRFDRAVLGRFDEEDPGDRRFRAIAGVSYTAIREVELTPERLAYWARNIRLLDSPYFGVRDLRP